MDTSTNPAVPLDVVFGETYNDKVFNHQTSLDVLHVIGQWLPLNKLGVEVPALM